MLKKIIKSILSDKSIARIVHFKRKYVDPIFLELVLRPLLALDYFLFPEKTNGKDILFDLSFNCSWGDKSIIFGSMAWLYEHGCNISILTGNWGQKTSINPKNYDPKKHLTKGKKFNKIRYLYHPMVEPVNFFKNIIAPTFNAEYFDLDTNQGSKSVLKQTYDRAISLDWKLMIGKPALETFQKKVSQFHYLIDSGLVNEDYKKVEIELKKTKNIILYATWDDSGKFKHLINECRGLNMPNKSFEKMVSLVKRIDNFCLKNPEYRIILFSKKAVDWEKILKSNYFDLRNFEDYNLSFSQAFYLVVNNSKASIGQTSSMMWWITCEKDVNHIVFTKHWKYSYLRNFKYFAKEGYEGPIERIFLV